MAGMKAGEIRRQNILNDLLQNECCTYEYLMSTYGISERSMQMDIKELCKQGYKIKGIKAKQGYVLQKEASAGQGYFEASDAQKVRKLFLMLILQNSAAGYTLGELESALKRYSDDCDEADSKTIRTALKELTDSKMIVCEQGIYRVSVNAPLQMALSTDRAMEILNLLETCAKGHHYEAVLGDIRKKLMIALFNEPEEEESSLSAYVVYNKSYEISKQLKQLLEELNQYAFEKYKLQITYRNRFGEERELIFATGNVVYSVDKDKLYLLGECDGEVIVINYSMVVKMAVTEEENSIFQNQFYREIVEDMFSISTKEAVHVKVRFDNVFRIKEKLVRLCSNRPKAELQQEGDYLYYEDDISGIYDFAGYLRRFGYGCKVIEPPMLCNIMRESAARILKAYEQLEETE